MKNLNYIDLKTIPADELEQIRIEAVNKVNGGKSRIEVSREMGIHYPNISKWVNLYKKHGWEGLRKQKKGKAFGLSPEQDKELKEILLTKSPKDFKIDSPRWTLKAINTLIFKKYNVKYVDNNIFRVLKRLDIDLRTLAQKEDKQTPAKNLSLKIEDGNLVLKTDSDSWNVDLKELELALLAGKILLNNG